MKSAEFIAEAPIPSQPWAIQLGGFGRKRPREPAERVEGEPVEDDAEEQRSQVTGEYGGRFLQPLDKSIFEHSSGKEECIRQKMAARNLRGSENVVTTDEEEEMRQHSRDSGQRARDTQVGARPSDGLKQQLNHVGLIREKIAAVWNHRLT
jgi:hypothetical protein